MTEGAAGPRVLELRVHGVANTKPHELLDLPRDEVRLAAGDRLGSFWEPTPAALAARTRAPGQPLDDRGEQTADVHREMYSWGGMVRSTPPEAGFGGRVLAVLARIGWSLLLPFSIANAGMWTWQLPVGGRPSWSARAAIMRVFGVLLTLLMAGTAAILALDVVGMQCFADGALRCAGLPGPFAAMAGWGPGTRIAVLSFAPVAVVGGLWWLSSTSRVRYDVADRIVGPADPGAAPAHDDGSSQLARRAFWLRDGATARLAMTHAAAGTALAAVLLATTWSGPSPVLGVACFAVSLALLLAALGTAAGTRTMPFERPAPERPTRSPWHSTLLALCVAAWLGTAVAVASATDACADAAAPELAQAPATCWSGIAVVDGIPFGIAGITVLAILGAALVLLAAMACFPVRRVTATPGQSQRRYRGWGGAGPVVFAACALALGLIWSSLMAVGVGDWLNGAAGASTLVTEAAPAAGAADARPDGSAQQDAVVPTGTDGATLGIDLDLPSLFPTFGVVALALLAVGALVALAAALRPKDLRARLAAWPRPAPATGGSPLPDTTGLATALPPDAVPAPGAAVADAPGAGDASGAPVLTGVPPLLREDHVEPGVADGSPGRDPQRPARTAAEYERFLAEPIRKARDHAARVHLVERLAGMLATGSAIAVLVATAAPWLASVLAAPLAPLFDLAMVAWALIAAVVVGSLVLGGDRAARPFGIIWDVTCFVPRTGHPLGPPCFAERAAPEIAGRILWWLDDAEQGAPREDRRVVLVAHSMGAVVATAALSILSLHPEAPKVRERLSYLTFGVQLRPWFGRFFPELLGPDTLGTTPCLAPRAFAADPWGRDFQDAAPASGSPLAAPGFRLPIDGWLNLWRPSDFLGFPAYSNRPAGNPVDLPAEEYDATGYFTAVATHGEYFRSPVYQRALRRLVDRR